MATENSVRSENKEVPIIREIMVATQSFVGTAELSPGIGQGNRAAFPDGQKLPRTFVI